MKDCWKYLVGFNNPVSAVYSDNPLNVNWIGYRVTLFLDAWAGDFSFIEDNWITMNLYSSPLFWIRVHERLGTFFDCSGSGIVSLVLYCFRCFT